MSEPGSPSEDGPKYKLSSFLFGNVDRRGQIEEYRYDEDLKSINNIDHCHVKEVEETAYNVISSETLPDCPNPSVSLNAPPPPMDYYDEQETISDIVMEESFRCLPPTTDVLQTHAASDEDYDATDEHTTQTEYTADATRLSTEDSQSPTNRPSTDEHSGNDLSASSIVDDDLPSRGATRSESPHVSEEPNARLVVNLTELDVRSCAQSDEALEINGYTDDFTSMPPPLHPAPVSASRQMQPKPLKSPQSPTFAASLSSELLDSTSANVSAHLIPDPDQLHTGTPLGSLMPPEYASVDITQLFPAYNPSRPPRWSNLFKLPHPLTIYRGFIERAPIVNSLLSERNTRHSDRLHLVYDSFLDLGEVPLPEEAIQTDDVVELSKPAPPGTDCLAGSENSWWRRAYAAALNEAANPPGRANSSAAHTEKPNGTSVGITNTTDHGDNFGAETEDTSANSSTVSRKQLYLGWRLGPAKYWYDQLGIPLDADITTWSEWRRPVGPCGANPPSVAGKYPAGIKNDVKLEEHDSFYEQETAVLQSDELNVIINNQPLVLTEDVDAAAPIQKSAKMQSHLPSPSPMLDKNSVLPKSSRTELPDTFFPYQLINWEDDIIYDPQLSASKIAGSAKMNAAYAGWIPSQHCRTMAAFQDAYQGKFPFIVGSKALNGLNDTTQIMEHLCSDGKGSVGTQNPPYSIFPVENQGILSDSWTYDIIYDSELPSELLPPPFLLTLDRNDETCLTDVIDDTAIAAAISAVRGPRYQRPSSINRISALSSDPTHPTTASGSLDSRDQVDRNTEESWTTSRFHLDSHTADAISSAPGSSAKHSAPLNRASLQVSFGLASTRGMLVGALAKAEHGAEKVKMILGKHGLLAEDDWHPEVDKYANGPLDETNTDLGAEGSVLASAAAAVSGIPPKDLLNLSNDEYYAIRGGALGMGGLARCGPLQHSTPAVELWPPFFPTYMSPLRLRQFHRVPLKRYLRGPMAQYNVPFQVTNLVRTIQRKAREREEEKAATGGGEIFFMRTPSDLSGSDGDVVLFEFSEEFPPLMTQIGMASRIINYYRPLTPRDRSLSPAPNAIAEPPDLPYGSLVYVSGTDSPFLGVIRPGGCLQTLENNMYRAPVYPHKMPETDFLLIRNRNGISIRRINNIFTVGQEIPLMEVPGPNSKRANNFVRDFLQVFILRLFLRSTDEPKRIKIEEIRKAFPNHSESSVRKRLKVCADFKRTGSDASWWVLRSDYRLPSEEEVRYLVSPEDCCAHYSMLAAELRLKDAGYGEKSLFVLDENQEEEEDKEGQPKMEDEVRAAPWNTTRAYLASQRGGCFLELHGAADPTGCGEAFSYSKTSAKPGALFRQAGGEVARGLLKGKRTVTGTDADLRKLHLRDARALLRSFGISEADLKTFKRWEIIDMVRFTSTERAKQGEEESSAKFARGNRLSMGEQVRCYREECQRIFDLQNRVLSNTELLSSDEEVSSEEEEEEVTGDGTNRGGPIGSAAGSSTSSIGGVRLSSLSSSARTFPPGGRYSLNDTENRREDTDVERLKRALESAEPLLGGKRPRKTNPAGFPPKDSTRQPAVVYEQSEATNGASDVSNSAVYDANASAAGIILDLPPPWPNAIRKQLRIIRTYSEEGRQYTRAELVPWSPVVEIYLKIRQTRSDDFIHNFVDSDDQFKEQQRKEKRRLQDQLRRLRKQQALMREHGGTVTSGPLRSGALSTGASRRRRHKPLTSALVKMRCGACGQTGHMRTNKECPMYGKSDAVAGPPVNSRRGLDRNRLKASTLTVNRAGAAQRVDLSKLSSEQGTGGITDPIAAAHALASRPVSELLAEQEEAENAVKDSNPHVGRELPDDKPYGDKDSGDSREQATRFGENDMTVEGTKLKLHSGLTKYIHEQNQRNLKLKIRRQLLDRLNAAAAVVQSVNAARRGLINRASTAVRVRRSVVNEDDFPASIKHRGNRRRIDPRVALNHIFEGIYKGLTQITGSKVFMFPVKEKDFPNYYSQITNPMDLSQIRMKINENAYSTREEFLSDIRLIYNNSLNFNGRFSSYTETAMKMCSHVMEEFCHKELKLMRLESLVNPLLDEDDLVGLSFLLQQAIEAMRSVEHSRPFHAPVDKRRYPNYYKLITNPMDLSSLEKLVKENRFRSREEFLTQAELIYSNCVTFNGLESPLTDVARKILAAGRGRLEQDAETLNTIELNIRRRLESMPEPQSATPHPGSPSNTSFSSLKGSTSTGVQRKTIKRRAETDNSAAQQRAKKSNLSASHSAAKDLFPSSDELHAGQNILLEPSTSESAPISSSDRTLRRRSTDAWYGVDLEYDDEEDMGEGTDCGRGPIAPNEYEGQEHNETLTRSTPDLTVSAPPWNSEEEEMATSVQQFSSPETRDYTIRGFHSDNSDPNGGSHSLPSHTQSSHSHPDLATVTTIQLPNHGQPSFSAHISDLVSEPNASDDEHSGTGGELADELYSEDSVDLPDWSNHELREDDYVARGNPSCVDEDSQYSVGDPSHQAPNLTADSVVQDLQLTDSDDGESLSAQGGELCTDADITLVLPDAFGRRNDTHLVKEAESARVGHRQTASTGLERGDTGRIEFFLGEDDDN